MQTLRAIELRPADRVLLLLIPEPEEARELASRVPGGLIVGVGPDEDVRAARRALRGVENAMFVPGDAGEIPWRDDFFTVAIARTFALPLETLREIWRVLAPRGRLVRLEPGEVPPALASAFEASDPESQVLVTRKGAQS